MNQVETRDIIAAAVIIPVVTIAAVTVARGMWRLCKRIGRWFVKRAQRFYTDTVRDAVAPELAHHAKQMTTAIDELKAKNTLEHAETTRHLNETSARLAAVESRQTDVESRLASVESKLNIRPTDARTRANDKENHE